jgi:hypothetical protein
MTTATLDRRESLIRRVHELSDSMIESVIAFIDDTEGHEPNDETIRAIEESMDPENLLGPYNSVEEMLKDFGINANA